MAGPSILSGGELNAAVTSALIGIHSEHLGRGPRTATTFHHGNVIVTLMHDVMTPLEMSLMKAGNAATVMNMRHLMQEAMRDEYVSAVERLSGREVIAFLSANHADPDMASEMFVLDAEL